MPNGGADFFAYDDCWVGREELVKALTERVLGSCRLLLIVGLTGIGKTALAERLAVELQDRFQGDWKNKLHRENFDNEGKATDFASVAARWLEEWGEKISPEEHKPDRLLLRVVTYLREHQVLVLIDSLEILLTGSEDGGKNDFADEWWAKFFQNWLQDKSPCQGRLIVTSQDLPTQIRAEGTRYQNFWYCQPLSGLEESERLNLFVKLELATEPKSSNEPYLTRIGQAYEGHPLALRVIAGEIKTDFNNNVAAYWNKYGNEIEEVEKAIAEAKHGKAIADDDQWQLHRYTDILAANVQHRLIKTFERLRKHMHDAYVLLCEAAVYRCPVPEEFWLSHLEDWDLDKAKQELALRALKNRYLVEFVIDDNNECLVRQHNLVRSVSLEYREQLVGDNNG